MGDDAPRDPLTELAAACTQMHELFSAYIEAGFRRDEALQIVIAIATAGVRPPS